MQLIHIAVFCAGALLYSALLPARWRGWALLIGSLIAIYWLQPPLNLRQWDFILPTISIGLAVWGWWLTRPQKTPLTREDGITGIVTLGIVMAVAFTRYLAPELRLTSRPPELVHVVVAIALCVMLALVIWRVLPQRRLALALSVIVALFIVTKAEPLAAALSALLRAGQGQDVTLAAAVDLGWLGYSYLAFRLIHTLRDRQTGLLPDLSLREYLTYMIFFPAYTAGPIDRAERFAPDVQALSALRGMDAARWFAGGQRIVIGLFKKFVIADSLALVALDAAKAEQAASAGGLWLLLYAYALRLFFDFSGYSDIAIGIARLFGVTLPENFSRPYTRQNIARFWQSWHMSLSSWARFYIFSPLSRGLLKRDRKLPQPVVILLCHLATMITIGLWHGITLPFLIWGLWHSVGLFVHKQWSDRTRRWYLTLKDQPRRRQGVTLASIALTFHFVVLGWVWFALPEVSLALNTFMRLFGVGW